MKNKSNSHKLLLISISIISLTIVAAFFWESFGLGSRESLALAIALIFSFGFNIAGLILAVIEKKEGKKANLLIGLHTLLILGILGLIISAALTM